MLKLEISAKVSKIIQYKYAYSQYVTLHSYSTGPALRKSKMVLLFIIKKRYSYLRFAGYI